MSADITLAEMLLQIESIKLNVEKPFTWASGWKSPIYCDNRKALAFTEVRNFIKKELAVLVKNNFDEIDIIAGVATAGISWGTLLADELELPFCYVRPEPKAHGLANQIEGNYKAGQKVLVIEDLISTGKSSLKVIQALNKAELNVKGLVSIFNYGFDEAIENFKTENVPAFSITNYKALLKIAIEKNLIKDSELNQLNNWRKNPSSWDIK